jgi:hypothetical protein
MKGAAMVAAGWVSGLPNPSGSAPLSQPSTANPPLPQSSPPHPEYGFLAQRLKHHLWMEEDILYPAALVTAEYVRASGTADRDVDRS